MNETSTILESKLNVVDRNNLRGDGDVIEFRRDLDKI